VKKSFDLPLFFAIILNIMGEKRRHERVVINITGDMVASSHIDVIDISYGGALIEYDKRLDIGKKLKFAITIDDRTVMLNGSVVRSSIVRSSTNATGESSPVYQAGVEFNKELTKNEKEILSVYFD